MNENNILVFSAELSFLDDASIKAKHTKNVDLIRFDYLNKNEPF